MSTFTADTMQLKVMIMATLVALAAAVPTTPERESPETIPAVSSCPISRLAPATEANS
jgi:hypothetical protein